MKKLREYYERELGSLQAFGAEFAAEFPAQAGRLGMAGGACDDPHIERFIQASALSNARIAQLIDDNDGKVTEALLAVNYPHYLRPFPAAAVVHVDAGATAATMSGVVTIARGAALRARLEDGPPCTFRTVQDVELAPLALSGAAFHPLIDIPVALPRPSTVTSSLSIRIDCGAGAADLRQPLKVLRAYIDGEPSLRAALRDAIFMRTCAAYLELPDGRWIALPRVPLAPVGYRDEEAMIPQQASSHPAYRLLTEYFAFPDKFYFFDIDWARLVPLIPAECRRVTLHLGLADVPADSAPARRLATLSAANFLLGCTPVVNLFRRSACPIELTQLTPDYELTADASPACAFDIYSVDRVRALRNTARGQTLTEFRPYYAVQHGDAGNRAGQYYLVRRDPAKAITQPGHETRIAFVDTDLDPLAPPETSVSIDLTCTNRDLPTQLRYGNAEGDLELEQATGGSALRFLQRPTAQCRFRPDAHWRLIAHLSLSLTGLVQAGASGLREMLTLYDLRESAIARSQIAGIKALQQRPARGWLRSDGHSSLVHGVEVRLTIDEEAFAGTSLHLFAQVLDHFFGLLVHLNSFTQLTVIAHATGKELLRCSPRHGAINLL